MILYVVGTEQIKGFAVTLFLGVVLSMYTAVFCARVVFDIAERQGWITKLTMMQMIHNPNSTLSACATPAWRSRRWSS